MRWTKITFRSLHILGIAGMSGGFIFELSKPLWQQYYQLAMFSGLGLLFLEIFGNGIWFIQLRGVGIYIKFLFLFLLFSSNSYQPLLFGIVTILSSVISHAPSKVRYFSVIHMRKVDAL